MGLAHTLPQAHAHALDGRWWLGVASASVIGVWLPGKFFEAMPSGAVSTQIGM